VFQMFNRLLPEANEAMLEAARFIRKIVYGRPTIEAA
jgi:hypothetical protein